MPILAYLNRCAWLPVAGGLVDFVFDTAKTGFYAPADCVNPPVFDGVGYDYFAESLDRSVHEEGRGVWDVATGTLTRVTIRNSSNAGAKVNFTSPPTVYMGSPDALNVSMAPQPMTITYTPSDVVDQSSYQMISPVAFQDVISGTFYAAPFGPWATHFLLDPNEFLVAYHGTLTEVVCDLVGTQTDVDFSASGFSAITTISFPNLQIIGGGLSLHGNVLTDLNMPLLRYTFALQISGMDSNVASLTTLSFPALERGSILLDTSSVLTTLDLPVLKYTGGFADGGFNIDGLTALTSLSLPEYLVGSLSVTNCTSLTSISAPLLTGSFMAVTGNAALTSVDLSSLTTQGPGSIFFDTNDVLTSLSFPSLTTGDVAGANSIQVTNHALLASIDLSALTATPSLVLAQLPSLTSLDLSALTTILPGSDGFDFEQMAALTGTLDLSALTDASSAIFITDVAASTIDITALVTIGGDLTITSCPNLVTFALASGLLSISGNVTIQDVLDQASVDGLLVSLAALDGSGGTTSYDNLTVDLTGGNASPGVTGLAAKVVLEGRGNTVNVN